MSYTSQAALIDRFGEDELIDASDRSQEGEIDPEVIDRAIADAGAQIDAHLRGRYALPVVDSSGAINRIAADLARYYLWGISAPEHVSERYKAAIATLRDLARGVITIDAPADQGRTGTRAPAVQASLAIVTDDALKGIRL